MKKFVKPLAGAAACAMGFLGYVYLTLPDVASLATVDPPTTAFMELRADEARARGEPAKRLQRWVSYGRVAGSLKRAVLVAEDSLFWEHDGVDIEQIKESLERDIQKGTFLRGGSTITQQLAKNLYLSPSKNPVRKLRELLVARRLEAALSKTRILELYLNVIEWGDGIYGADAAARTYFKKPASALTPDESALLAACIINPRIMNPAHLTPRLARRQKLILGRMGVVTPPPDLALSLDEPAKSPPKLEQPGAGEPDKAAAVKPVSAGEAEKPIK